MARLATITAAASCALLANAAVAQEPGSRQTRDFVQAAAQSDQFEIMEAQTALAQSTDPQIRGFAQQMIEAHQQTSEVLRQATVAAGLEPAKPGISGDQSMLLAALQSQRGKDLDKAYLRHQVLAHSAALAVEQGYASSGDDATIKQAAASAVPIIAAHLDMARKMAAAMGDA